MFEFNNRKRPTPRLIAALCLLLFVLGSPAVADRTIVSRYVPDAVLVGKARLRYLVWDVYDAELYAPQGRWRRDAPYALSINYLRTLSGEAIAKSSADEIRKQGFQNTAVLAEWQRRMETIFPDVEIDTNLTGIRDKNGHTVFFFDGRKVGIVEDREFTERFFDIWLGPKTSRPGFQRQLTGAR